MNRPIRAILLAMLLSAIAIVPGQAQSGTTSSIAGSMVAGGGGALMGASMVALHLPSGIRRVTTTDMKGHFDLSTMHTSIAANFNETTLRSLRTPAQLSKYSG